MRNPLSYQISEYDCGPTTMLNAMSFLFKREEIPPDIIKQVMLYCLDSYNVKGEAGKSGTSRMAMMFLSSWLNQFGKMKKFPVHCEFLTGGEVRVSQNSRIVSSLQQGGAVVVRLRYGCWHYVLLTGADGGRVCLFDPYFRKRPFDCEGIEMVPDAPERMNRKVRYDVIDAQEKGAYALGPLETREAMILFNRNTQRTPANSIEYFI